VKLSRAKEGFSDINTDANDLNTGRGARRRLIFPINQHLVMHPSLCFTYRTRRILSEDENDSGDDQPPKKIQNPKRSRSRPRNGIDLYKVLLCLILLPI
jgi:hypothetical protein